MQPDTNGNPSSLGSGLMILWLSFIMLVFLSACSDQNDEKEFSFVRAIQELQVIKDCPDGSETVECFQLRWVSPMETDGLQRFHVWLDTAYVNEDDQLPSDAAKENSIVVDYEGSIPDIDTLDLTSRMVEFQGRERILVSIWPEYSGGSSTEIKNIEVFLVDDIDPGPISYVTRVSDSSLTLSWIRPTDQIDYYNPFFISGPIVGYNLHIQVEDNEIVERADADISNSAYDLLQSGNTEAQVKNGISLKFIDGEFVEDETSDSDFERHFYITDGLGYDTSGSQLDSNSFQFVLEGLPAEARISWSIVAWDENGNSRSTEQQYLTLTDSLQPVMAPTLFFTRDSLDSSMALIDSNQVYVFWHRAVDPLRRQGFVEASGDTVLIPSGCSEGTCWRDVMRYELYRSVDDSLILLPFNGGGVSEKYSSRYVRTDSGFVYDSTGTGLFVSDTLRYITPGDSMILHIVAIDSSGFASDTLVDTIRIAPITVEGLTCPPGWVAEFRDTSFSADSSLPLSQRGVVFCIEEYEHRDSTGSFVTNVLWEEARAHCQALQNSDTFGLRYDLCRNQDWQFACNGTGRSPYGVIERENIDVTEFLFSECNAGTGESQRAESLSSRSEQCVSPVGVYDLPGQYQEWVLGYEVVLDTLGDTLSADTLGQLKGSSYLFFDDVELTTLTQCVATSKPYRYRPDYTDSVAYLYRAGVRIDTLFSIDTSRSNDSLTKLVQADFRDTLNFYGVYASAESSDSLGYDYINRAELRRRGEDYVQSLAGDLDYRFIRSEVVLIKGTRRHEVSRNFYQAPSIGFRCCAYQP